MRPGKLFSLTSILVLFCSIAFAQATSTTTQPSDPSAETDAAKKKKELDERIMQMIDQALNDGNALRLPQNKALIFAIAGDLYWKFDEKRGRELFRNAASEIISYNAETEKEHAQQQNNGPRGGGVLLFRYIPQIQMLGKADLTRMSQAADRFTRSDIRTLVRLFVLQGFLREDKKPTAPATPAAPGGAGNNSNF